MNSLPNVILNIKAYTPFDKSDKNAFYRCKSTKNIISYLNRDTANNLTKDLVTYSESKEELGLDRSIIDYADKRPGSTGLFNSNGKMSVKDIEKTKKNLQTTESNIWSMVISFTPEVAKKICNNKSQAIELVNNNLEKLFKDTQIKFENIDWYGAYHTNTNNRHIHLICFEKKPLCISSSGKNKYTFHYKLNKESIANFKFSLTKDFVPNNTSFYSLRDTTRKGIAQSINNNKNLLLLFYGRAEDIFTNGNFQYSKLTKDNKQLVDSFVKEIITSDKELFNTYNSYKKELIKQQAQFIYIYKQNNEKTIPAFCKNYFDNRMVEFNTRLGNEVLKGLKIFHNQHSQYVDYKKTKKQFSNNYMMKQKRCIDYSNKTANAFIFNLTSKINQSCATQTQEYYEYLKKVEGEAIYA